MVSIGTRLNHSFNTIPEVSVDLQSMPWTVKTLLLLTYREQHLLFCQAVLEWHDASEVSVQILIFTKKMGLPQMFTSLFHCRVHKADKPELNSDLFCTLCMQLLIEEFKCKFSCYSSFIIDSSFHGNYTLFSTYKLSYAIQFSLAAKRQQTLGTLTITLPESMWTQEIHNYFIVNKDKAIDWSMLQGSTEVCRDIIQGINKISNFSILFLNQDRMDNPLEMLNYNGLAIINS